MDRRMKFNKAIMLVIAVFILCLALPSYGVSAQGDEYVIRTGSFKIGNNAQQEVKRLKAYNAFMRQETVAGTLWSRVYIGPYKTDKEAQSAARKLAQQKTITAFIIERMKSKSPDWPAMGEKKTAPQKESPVLEPVAPRISAVATSDPSPKAPVMASEQLKPEAQGAAKTETPALQEAEKKTPSEETAILPPLEPVPIPIRDEGNMPKTAAAPKPPKSWSVTAGYNLMYVDMSQKYINANFISTGILHGPTLGFTKNNLGLSLTYLTSLGNTLDGDGSDSLDSGEIYNRRESLKRNDFEGSIRYKFYNKNELSLAVLAGFKYTRLSEIATTFERAAGQYTITGDIDIWGPSLGVEMIAPIGRPFHTPFYLSFGATGMYLTADGQHPQFVPASGGLYGTTFTGADFSSNGWGGNVYGNLIWKIMGGLQFHIGAILQSARLIDSSPEGYTMRMSNGYYGVYTRFIYDW